MVQVTIYLKKKNPLTLYCKKDEKVVVGSKWYKDKQNVAQLDNWKNFSTRQQKTYFLGQF